MLRKFPYGVRGGIISVIGVFIITFILYIIQPTCNHSWSGGCFSPLWSFIIMIPVGLVETPLSIIIGKDLWDEFMNFGDGIGSISGIGGIIIPILFYFLIGVFGEWVVRTNKKS